MTSTLPLHRGPRDLNAGSNRRAALLIALGAPVTLPPRDAIFARTLAAGLVADLARGAHGMAVAGLACLVVGDGLLGVAEVALLAVVAMAAGGVVPALETHPSAHAPAQLEELHVEAATAGVVVALAGHALVGGGGGGTPPWAVKVERLALLALAAGGVVLAGARHLAAAIDDALGGVAVALAPPTNRQVGHAHPLELRLLLVRDQVVLVVVLLLIVLILVFEVVGQSVAAAELVVVLVDDVKEGLVGRHQLLAPDQVQPGREVDGLGLLLLQVDLDVVGAAGAVVQVQEVLGDRGEHDPDVGGRHPILKDGAVFEVLGARPLGQGGEGDSGVAGLVQVVT